MNILFKLILNSISIFITGYLLSGVYIESVWVAFITAVVFAVINTFVRPILLFLTLPITILTLGVFAFIINVLLVLLVSYLVVGFNVDGFLWAILFSLLVSVINSVLGAIGK